MALYLNIVSKSRSNKKNGYMGVGNPPSPYHWKHLPMYLRNNIFLMKIRGGWFVFPSFGSLKQKKDDVDIFIGDGDIGI